VDRRQPNITLSVLHLETAFNVRTAHGEGTCFLYRDDDGLFFVSAAHLFKEVKANETVFLRHTSGWEPSVIEEISLHPDGADVCCFVIVGRMPTKLDINYQSEISVFLGDELKFIGFLHKLALSYDSRTGLATGLVRTAFFSGFCEIEGQKMWILDGFNNKGYSGGPLYSLAQDGQPAITGVVVGFRHEQPELSQLYRKEGGATLEVEDHFVMRMNSGMIYAHGIAAVRQTAKKLSIRQDQAV